MRSRLRAASIALALCLAGVARGEDPGFEHLLKGAEAFRSGAFAVALVEFQVAEQQGAGGEASWYVAATLVKLHRPSDALAAFAHAESAAPSARDALFDFYEALACYDARLYSRADQLLSRIGPQAGPHLAGQASTLRTQLSGVLHTAPGRTTAEWYRTQAAQLRSAGHDDVARLYDEEGKQVESREVLVDGGQAAKGAP